MSLSVQIIPKISLNWQFKIKNYARYFGLNIYPDIYDEKDIFRLFSVHNKTLNSMKNTNCSYTIQTTTPSLNRIYTILAIGNI